MTAVQDLLRENQVLDLGPLPAPRLAPSATVHQALQFLTRGKRGAIVIVEGLRPVGVFTERDVVYRLPTGLFTSRAERKKTALREVMSKPAICVQRQDKLMDAIEIMVERQHRHLVVVDRHGDLKGLLTTADLVQFLTDHFPENMMNLPPHLRQQYSRPEGA